LAVVAFLSEIKKKSANGGKERRRKKKKNPCHRVSQAKKEKKRTFELYIFKRRGVGGRRGGKGEKKKDPSSVSFFAFLSGER